MSGMPDTQTASYDDRGGVSSINHSLLVQIGKRIGALRMRKGWTQIDMAVALDMNRGTYPTSSRVSARSASLVASHRLGSWNHNVRIATAAMGRHLLVGTVRPLNEISPRIRGSKITDALAAQGGIIYGHGIYRYLLPPRCWLKNFIITLYASRDSGRSGL